MADPRARFDAALAAFAVKGNRWHGTSALTYWGAACGMTAEEVTAAAHGVGVTNRDADIRAGMTTAAARVSENAERWKQTAPTRTGGEFARRHAEPKKPPQIVRAYISAGADLDTPDALSALSPVRICADGDALSRRVMCEQQLLAMFSCDEVVRLRRSKEDNTRSAPSQNMKRVRDWISGGVHAADFGEVVRVNPLTGAAGQTRDGKQSFDAQSCVAAFRHMVFEFDELPLADQCRFWAGFIRRSRLADRLVCLVHSGGKSIHGVVSVDAIDEPAFGDCRAAVVRAFASDTDGRYRLDAQALMPLTGARLAGAIRKDTGNVQRLLYVRAKWRDGDLWQKLNPSDKDMPATCQAATPDEFAAHCPICPTAEDCKRAFGIYWGDKSHGGKGCNRPFAYVSTNEQQTESGNPTATQTDLF